MREIERNSHEYLEMDLVKYENAFRFKGSIINCKKDLFLKKEESEAKFKSE